MFTDRAFLGQTRLVSVLVGALLWGVMGWAQSSWPLHVEAQVGLSVPTGSALRAPYALGPEAQVGLSWLSAEQRWLLRLQGGVVRFTNRPDVEDITRHEVFSLSLQGGPGVRIGERSLLHLPLGVGYAWARDVFVPMTGDELEYLRATGFTGQAGLCWTWRGIWTLEGRYLYFDPFIDLGESVQQALINRGSIYSLFTVPNQRFAMHRMTLMLGVRW